MKDYTKSSIEDYFVFIDSFSDNFSKSQKEKSLEYSYIGNDISLCMKYLYNIFMSFPDKNSLFLNYYCIQSNLINDYGLYLLHLDKDFLHDIVNDSLLSTYNFVLRTYGENFVVTPVKYYLKSFSRVLLFTLKNKLRKINTEKKLENDFLENFDDLDYEINDKLLFSDLDIKKLW